MQKRTGGLPYMNSDVDFVILWVDGKDPEWMKEKERFSPKEAVGNSANRFRDWDVLQYFFRGVEKFAPWVRKVHFVTWGHLPPWLNKECPKLHIVNHRDYIPEGFLPTFNSNVIELFAHRIPELSQKFVMFNDDMFLTKPVSQKYFFKGDLPCDRALLGIVAPYDQFSFIKLNNWAVINHHFDKKKTVRNHLSKFFSPSYGMHNLRNMFLMLWPRFFGVNDPHLPLAYRKEIFEEVWSKEEAMLTEVATHRFRQKDDVSHWLMRYWQLLNGDFAPSAIDGCTFVFEPGRNNKAIYEAVRKQKYATVCLNDSNPDIDFEYEKECLKAAFQAILPEKSVFEV